MSKQELKTLFNRISKKNPSKVSLKALKDYPDRQSMIDFLIGKSRKLIAISYPEEKWDKKLEWGIIHAIDIFSEFRTEETTEILIELLDSVKGDLYATMFEKVTQALNGRGYLAVDMIYERFRIDLDHPVYASTWLWALVELGIKDDRIKNAIYHHYAADPKDAVILMGVYDDKDFLPIVEKHTDRLAQYLNEYRIDAFGKGPGSRSRMIISYLGSRETLVRLKENIPFDHPDFDRKVEAVDRKLLKYSDFGFYDTRMNNWESSGKVVKIGRNDPCMCGSGKKYKKCCGKSENVVSEHSLSAGTDAQNVVPIFPDRNPARGSARHSGPKGIEKEMRNLQNILSEREFESEEEVEKYLNEILQRGKIPKSRPKFPLDRAQELADEAYEYEGKKRLTLARKALEISPDCADAYVLLADDKTNTLKEAINLYSQGVEAGKRALGKKIFEEERGHFWGLLETRPFMRAKCGLAISMWEIGDRDEAIKHLEEMLELNPNDNQGMRYSLMSWYLQINNDKGLTKLFSQYGDEPNAFVRYARALRDFRVYGTKKSSVKRLRDAFKANILVPAYILGQRKMPAELPDSYATGDDSEAVICADLFGPAWFDTPKALEWLADNWAKYSK